MHCTTIVGYGCVSVRTVHCLKSIQHHIQHVHLLNVVCTVARLITEWIHQTNKSITLFWKVWNYWKLLFKLVTIKASRSQETGNIWIVSYSHINYIFLSCSCIRGMALLDLVLKSAKRHVNYLKTCYVSLELISEELREMYNKTLGVLSKPSLKHSKTSDMAVVSTTSSFTSCGNVTKELNQEQQSLLQSVNFDKVVGCDLAKQMLYENVILPLKLDAMKKQTFFSGLLEVS